MTYRSHGRRRSIETLIAAAILALAMGAVTARPASAQSGVLLIGQSNLERSGAGLDQTCRIQVTPADGVTDLDLVFTYDPAVLAPTAVFRTGFTQDFILTSSLDVPGIVEIHLSGGVPLSGTGDVAWVAFDVIASAGSVGSLAWSSAVLNGGGIASTPVLIRDISVATSDVTISVLDGIQASAPTTIDVDITTTAFGSSSSIDLDLRFNEAVASVTDVQKTALSSPLNLAWNVPMPGVLKIVLFGAGSISGSGSLVRVTFDVTGGGGGNTPLSLERTRISESIKLADDGSLLACPATLPSESPTLVLSQPGGTLLDWTQVTSATTYDVVRGELGPLQSTGGDFNVATGACVADDLAQTSVEDPDAPQSGEGFWYLVAPGNCLGSGSYDTGEPSQSGQRDSEIQSSPQACAAQ